MAANPNSVLIKRKLLTDEKKQNLLSAIEKGDLAQVQTLINNTNDLLNSALDDDENTALHIAVMSNNLTIATWLLQCGSDVNARNQFHETPLCCATRDKSDSLDMVQLLLSYGADISIVDNLRFTPLQIAIQRQNTAVVIELMKLSSSISIPELLLFATHHRSTKIVELLIVEMGGTPDLRENSQYLSAFFSKFSNDNNTLLHIAVQNNDAPTTQLLIDLGADVSAKNRKEKTPANLAPQNSDIAMLFSDDYRKPRIMWNFWLILDKKDANQRYPQWLPKEMMEDVMSLMKK